MGPKKRRVNQMKLFKSFRKDELGAVTVDWVVLTAAVVALALGAISLIDTAVSTQVSTISSKVTGAGS